MTFLCVGLSHKQAPIAVREQLAIRGGRLRARAAARAAAGREGGAAHLHLQPPGDLRRRRIARAAEDIVETLGPVAAPHAMCRFDDEALRHLFRVAASLDSMVVGEPQILGQVKDAAAHRAEGGTLGAELSGRARRGLRRRQARAHRDGDRARRGVGSQRRGGAGAQALRQPARAGRAAGGRGRDGGAGGARADVRRARASCWSRTATRARGGAGARGGRRAGVAGRAALAARAGRRGHLLHRARRSIVVTRENMARALKARRYRPLFMVDLTLPRNVEPGANELENVYVYDLDDLERVAAQNRDLRAAQVAEGGGDRRGGAAGLSPRRSRERRAVPVLARLRAQAEAIARAEVERTLAALHGLDEKQQKSVRAMASAIVNKLLARAAPRGCAPRDEGPWGRRPRRCSGCALGSRPGVAVPIPAPPSPTQPVPEPEPQPAGRRLGAAAWRSDEPCASPPARARWRSGRRSACHDAAARADTPASWCRCRPRAIACSTARWPRWAGRACS